MKKWWKVAGLIVVTIFVPGGLLVGPPALLAMLLSHLKRGKNEKAGVQTP